VGIDMTEDRQPTNMIERRSGVHTYKTLWRTLNTGFNVLRRTLLRLLISTSRSPLQAGFSEKRKQA